MVLGLDMRFLRGKRRKLNTKAKTEAKTKAKVIDQSLRPSGFAPAFGRVVAASRLARTRG